MDEQAIIDAPSLTSQFMLHRCVSDALHMLWSHGAGRELNHMTSDWQIHG